MKKLCNINNINVSVNNNINVVQDIYCIGNWNDFIRKQMT